MNSSIVQQVFPSAFIGNSLCNQNDKIAGNTKPIEVKNCILEYHKTDSGNKKYFNQPITEYVIRQVQPPEQGYGLLIGKEEYHLQTDRRGMIELKRKYCKSKDSLSHEKIKKRKLSKSSNHFLNNNGSNTNAIPLEKKRKATKEKERRDNIIDSYTKIKALLRLDGKMKRHEVLSKCIQYIKVNTRLKNLLPEVINERKERQVYDIEFDDKEMTCKERCRLVEREERKLIRKKMKELRVCLGISDEEKVKICELLERIISWINKHNLAIYSGKNDIEISEFNPLFNMRTSDSLTAGIDTRHWDLSSKLTYVADEL